jgi:hypothetical protein
MESTPTSSFSAPAATHWRSFRPPPTSSTPPEVFIRFLVRRHPFSPSSPSCLLAGRRRLFLTPFSIRGHLRHGRRLCEFVYPLVILVFGSLPRSSRQELLQGRLRLRQQPRGELRLFPLVSPYVPGAEASPSSASARTHAMADGQGRACPLFAACSLLVMLLHIHIAPSRKHGCLV